MSKAACLLIAVGMGLQSGREEVRHGTSLIYRAVRRQLVSGVALSCLPLRCQIPVHPSRPSCSHASAGTASAQLHDLQQQLSDRDRRLAGAQAEVATLRSQLGGEQQRIHDLEEALQQHVRERRASGQPADLVRTLTNKKNEDDAYDVEAAVLTGGGSGGFQPLAGMFRGAPMPLSLKPFVAAAHQTDRLSVMLDRRPAARAGVLMYVVLLHMCVAILL